MIQGKRYIYLPFNNRRYFFYKKNRGSPNEQHYDVVWTTSEDPLFHFGTFCCASEDPLSTHFFWLLSRRAFIRRKILSRCSYVHLPTCLCVERSPFVVLNFEQVIQIKMKLTPLIHRSARNNNTPTSPNILHKQTWSKQEINIEKFMFLPLNYESTERERNRERTKPMWHF